MKMMTKHYSEMKQMMEDMNQSCRIR